MSTEAITVWLEENARHLGVQILGVGALSECRVCGSLFFAGSGAYAHADWHLRKVVRTGVGESQ